jgi:hypothetical protein
LRLGRGVLPPAEHGALPWPAPVGVAQKLRCTRTPLPGRLARVLCRVVRDSVIRI